MNTAPYVIAIICATAYVANFALHVAAGTNAWRRASRTLPVRRIRGLLFGGPFLLVAACGGAPSTPDNGCPMAEPTQCLSDYSPDAGPEVTQVCTDTTIDDFNCGGCGIKCGGYTPTCIDSKCTCVPDAKSQVCEIGKVFGVVRCGAAYAGCDTTVNCGGCPSGQKCATGHMVSGIMYCQ